MKIIKYVFALVLLVTSSTKIISMDFDDTHCHQIREVGMTADIEGAQKLLDEGMPVNARGLLGSTMLLHAMAYVHETDTNKIPKEKRLEFVDFLISKGAELHPSTDSWTKVPVLAAQFSNIGPEFLDLLKDADFLVDKKVHYAGFLDFYFYDTERDLAKYCPGMKYNRKGEPHGAGRILHRSILESLNWVLWDDKLSSGLDASMTKRLRTLDITTWFGNIPEGMYAVDLKTSDNIHRIEEYPGVMMNDHEKAQLLNHFSLQYV